MRLALSAGTSHAALYQGTVCLAGDGLAALQQISTACESLCGGSALQVCGGSCSASVYSVRQSRSALQTGPGCRLLANGKGPFSLEEPITSCNFAHAVTFMGCYKEPTCASSVFSSYLKVVSRQMTAALCARLAVPSGYEYTAVQNGSDCFIGNPYNRDSSGLNEFTVSLYGSLPAGTCNSPCAGMAEETCGGSCSSELWKVPRVQGDSRLTLATSLHV
jgi:hypothetical protein